MHSHARPFGRRRFLGGLTLAGTAGLLGLHAKHAAAEPPPETTRLRLARNPVLCFAPQFVADELLRLEGFTDVQYVTAPEGPYVAVAAGEADINTGLGVQFILRIDAGDPLVILTGTHAGGVLSLRSGPTRVHSGACGRRLSYRFGQRSRHQPVRAYPSGRTQLNS